jgi:hypothetical protein
MNRDIIEFILHLKEADISLLPMRVIQSQDKMGFCPVIEESEGSMISTRIAFEEDCDYSLQLIQLFGPLNGVLSGYAAFAVAMILFLCHALKACNTFKAITQKTLSRSDPGIFKETNGSTEVVLNPRLNPQLNGIAKRFLEKS